MKRERWQEIMKLGPVFAVLASRGSRHSESSRVPAESPAAAHTDQHRSTASPGLIKHVMLWLACDQLKVSVLPTKLQQGHE